MIKLKIKVYTNFIIVTTFMGGYAMERIKNLFKDLTGTTIFMFILGVIFTILNILNNTVFKVISDEIINTTNSLAFSSENASMFGMFGVSDMFYGIKKASRSSILVVSNILGWYVSIVIGKFCNSFKPISVMWIDLKSDNWLAFAIMIYNGIDLSFYIYTIYSFVKIIK